MSTPTTDLALPVLDLSQLQQGPAEAERFRVALRQATHEYGFFYLIGHGVEESLTSEMIKMARRFFALPEAAKLAIANTNSPQFRGYTRVGGELTQGRVDWREQLDIGPERPAVEAGPDVPAYLRLEGPNLWPAELPELRDVVTRWESRLTDLGQRLLRAWAESLSAAPDVFAPAFGDRPSTFIKIVRYPSRTRTDHDQGVGAHKDAGVLTLLLVEPGKVGLQVERDGRWIDAPPLPGAFIVNIGELLEYATGGYLKATVHRVISPDDGLDRISIPFFLNPALDSTFPRLQLPPELQRHARGVTADPDNPIYGVYGENALKWRLRSHPDVAAIHHADLLTRAAAAAPLG
ncbi:MAG TPA: 2-oxoglutarate and iron-dependent oxygenase domain-containing protein [Micromonosporaceae bacterium]|nr:2-oxoglutarate and iron-dependent oxygenase domain-containing protein [Micromonosporaceae bacterium]